MKQNLEQKTAKTQNLVFIALFAALSCVATMALRIPSPTGGYLNLGDTMVLLGAYLLGPVPGALAGGIGSGLADLLSGYPVYVPATLVIKAVMAWLAGNLFSLLGNRGLGGVLLCGIVGEVPMVVGYWLFDAWLAASGQQFFPSLMAALVGVPSNLVQATFGIIASTLLRKALQRSSAVRRTFPRL